MKYVADGWGITFLDDGFIDKILGYSRKGAIEYFINGSLLYDTWIAARNDGYRCERVYRKVEP